MHARTLRGRRELTFRTTADIDKEIRRLIERDRLPGRARFLERALEAYKLMYAEPDAYRPRGH
jgi:hypothetical protein